MHSPSECSSHPSFQMPAPYQSVWLAASIISLGEQVNALVPAEAVYHVPSVLEVVSYYGFIQYLTLQDCRVK
jgi:hypothetical protein